MNSFIQDDEIVFNISQVAKIIDVVPATIRNWEKSGLFTAKRKGNNYRVYNLDDIETLKKIRMLSVEQNMGTVAIKNTLIPHVVKGSHAGDSEQSDASVEYSKEFLSHKWKKSRERLGHTLEEVAGAVGISASYLSRLENGLGNVSFDVMKKLAGFYGASILDFFEMQESDHPLVKNGTGERPAIDIPGLRLESLVAQHGNILSPMLFELEPGCSSPEIHRHHGEEFIYVLSGVFHVTLDHDDEYMVCPGDSLYFQSIRYHGWINKGPETCRLLWVHSPIEPSR